MIIGAEKIKKKLKKWILKQVREKASALVEILAEKNCEKAATTENEVGLRKYFFFKFCSAGTGLKFVGFMPARVLAIELQPTLGSLQLTAEPVGPQLIAQA